MTDFDRAFSTNGVTFGDVVGVHGGAGTPESEDVNWPNGSIYLRTTGQVYKKTGGSWVELGTGGGSTGPLPHIDLYTTVASNLTPTGTWIDIPWDTQRNTPDTEFSHSETVNNDEITINESAHYLVMATITTEATSGSSRSESHMRIMYDDNQGGGFVEVPGTHVGMYNRNASQGVGNGSAAFMLHMAPVGSKIKVQAQRTSGNNVISTHADGCSVTIIKMQGTTGAAGAAGNDGNDGADGTDGSVWHTGSTVPSDVLGVDGDFYLRDGTGDVYQKSGGTWGSPVANIQGPAGGGGIAEAPIDGDAYVRVDATWQRGATHEDIRVQNGFENRTDSTISFVEGTRTFSIQPAVTEYSFWAGGRKITKTGTDNIVIPDVEGIHYIYFDETGTLVTTQTFSLGIIDTYGYITAIYWDATNNEAVYFGEERHGRGDNEWHKWAHTTIGTQYVSGLSLGNMIVNGNGDLDTHAQMSVADGAIRDEDIFFSINDDSPQDLSTIAQIPLFYRDGVAGDWRKIAATNFPVTTAGSGRAAYNEYTGATWQLTEVATGDFVLTHLIATLDTRHPIIGIIGQNTYLTRAEAEAGANDELLNLILGALDGTITEWKAIATVIFQTANGKSNAVKSSVEATEDGSDYVDWRINALASSGTSGAITDHGLLNGLADDDHTQYHNDTRGDARYYTQAQVDGRVTFENLNTNGDVGTGANQVAQGDHTHSASQLAFGHATIGAQSGTSSLPNGNTSPTTGDGTQIFSQQVTLDNAANQVRIQIAAQCECSADEGAVGIAVFRGSTCIGGNGAFYNRKDPGEGFGPLAVNIVDSPGSVGPHTYSVRVGQFAGGGTWYIARTATVRWNGAMSNASTVTLQEIVP